MGIELLRLCVIQTFCRLSPNCNIFFGVIHFYLLNLVDEKLVRFLSPSLSFKKDGWMFREEHEKECQLLL